MESGLPEALATKAAVIRQWCEDTLTGGVAGRDPRRAPRVSLSARDLSKNRLGSVAGTHPRCPGLARRA